MIVQEPGLLHLAGAAQGVRPGGGILINSPKSPEELGFSMPERNVISIAANAMAVEFLGEPIPNTALLAGLLNLTGMLPMKSLEALLAHRFRGDALERNLSLMRAAAERVPSGSWRLGS